MRSILAGTTVPNVTRLPAPRAAQTTAIESPKVPSWAEDILTKMGDRESKAQDELEQVKAALVSAMQQKADGDAALAAALAKLEVAEKRVQELTAELAKARVPAKVQPQPAPQIVLPAQKPDDRGWVMYPHRDAAGELLYMEVKRPEN